MSNNLGTTSPLKKYSSLPITNVECVNGRPFPSMEIRLNVTWSSTNSTISNTTYRYSNFYFWLLSLSEWLWIWMAQTTASRRCLPRKENCAADWTDPLVEAKCNAYTLIVSTSKRTGAVSWYQPDTILLSTIFNIYVKDSFAINYCSM